MKTLETTQAPAGLTGLGFPTISYGVDGEGRPTTVGDGSSAGAVSAASYNGYGEVTGLTLGSGDSDAFGYDAATGRMTEYQYTVDGTTDTGLLGWNANGSLATLAIADNLSGSGDTQSCSYGYDELERLGSEDCGTGWERSFSYDDFGNAAASGTQSFAADFGSNQIGEVGSYTAGYDKDGDLVNDPVTGTTGEYGWDVEGKLVKAGSVTITRDALGRAAETYDGTTYREVAYAPGGGPVGRLSGGSMVEADVPLPGGGAAVYTGTSGPPARYEHADWEGSVRLTTTAAQGVYGTEAYGAFGAMYDGTGTSPVNYTGERQDTVTGTAGLYDFLMREESPTQGRWLNPDPAGMAAVDPGNPQTWNRYAYVTNQPTFQTDPLGLLQQTPPFGCIYGPDDDGLECLPPTPGPPAPGPPGAGGPPQAPPTQPKPPVKKKRSGWLNTITSVFGHDQDDPRPSCFGDVFGETAGEDLNPLSIGPGDAAKGALDVAAAAKFNQALAYAAGAGLTSPYQSSVFRSFMSASEKLGDAADFVIVLQAVYALSDGLYAEWGAAQQGACQ